MARVCLIRQGYHPLDTRVRREVDALTAAGHDVDVICARRPGQPYRERLGCVTVLRLPLAAARTQDPLGYVLRYAAFGLAAALVAAALWRRRRWDVVQVNSMPDALVFAAAVPRMLGARVLLDLHECMPEFFATKFGVRMNHPAVRLLVELGRVEAGGMTWSGDLVLAEPWTRGRRGAAMVPCTSRSTPWRRRSR